MFGKKANLIGLDIGSRTIKLAEVDNKKKILKRFAATDIPPGYIEDGAVRNSEGIVDAIRQLHTRSKAKERNVALAIGGYSVIVETVTLPDVSPQELQEKVKSEIEPIIPYDMSDVYFDFQDLGPVDGAEDKRNAIVVAAKKDMVNEYVSIVEEAGLKACVVDIDAFALQNIYTETYGVESEGVALIDVGANKTTLNILKGTRSVFTRDVAMGCHQINLKIVSQIGCTPEEAERTYRNKETDKISTKELGEIIESVVTAWCTEIRRAFDFYYTKYPDDPIGKIYLSGGGANIKKFRQLLAVEASSEVEVIDPFEGFTHDRGVDGVLINRMKHQGTICMGLAIRQVFDKI